MKNILSDQEHNHYIGMHVYNIIAMTVDLMK